MSRATTTLALLLAVWSTRPPSAQEPGRSPSRWTGLRAIVETLADSFGPVVREPGLDAVRARLSRAGVVPSRIFDDDEAWKTRGPTWRAVDMAGYEAGGTYRLGLRAEAPWPAAQGQYRGRLRLERLASGRYEWRASDDLGIGAGRAGDVAAVVDTLFRGAERSTSTSARAALTAALPRSTAQFGRVFRLDTLTVQRDGYGATAVRLSIRIVPDGIRGSAPSYAKFLDEHARPMRLALVVADPAGNRWWTLDAADAVWTLRLRIRDGSLVPLEGPANSRIPARLVATADVGTKLGRFGVGARQVVAGLQLTSTAAEKGVTATFLREPDWQLPFLVETVLDSPLRFPFESPGSDVTWAVRETPGGAVLHRRYRARVRESWILRWLGGMVNDAVGDFRRESEREADRYTRACLVALRDDLAALDGAR